MSLSAMIRWLIATYDWLVTAALPSLRELLRNLRAVAQIAREKLESLPRPDLRFPLFRIQIPKLWPSLHWIRETVGTCLIWGLSFCLFLSFWVWAWTP